MSYTVPKLADWLVNSTANRFFFLDFVSGSDTNLGYIDAPAGTVFTAPQLVGVPLKTFTRLFELLPTLGNRRKVVVLVKNDQAGGTTYLKPDGITTDDVDFSNLTGYVNLLVRASTDLTNSVADKLICGARQGQVGPNGDGSFTCAAGATGITFSIAAGALTAEPGLIGMRVRFTGNVTAGLLNVTSNIQANTGTAITVGTGITAPAAGDTFFIERPGVIVNSFRMGMNSPTGVFTNLSAVPYAGVGFAVSQDVANVMTFSSSGTLFVSFMETLGTANATHLNCQNSFRFTSSRAYPDETGTNRVTGFGNRVLGDYSLTTIMFLTFNDFAATKAGVTANATRLARIRSGTVYANGSYLSARQQILECGLGPGSGAVTTFKIGSSTAPANPSTRSIGGFTQSGSHVSYVGIDITSAGGLGAISVGASGAVTNSNTITVDNCTGSTGNTGPGLDFSFSVNTSAVLGNATANTVTGTLGDIRLDGNVITTHVSLTQTNIKCQSAGDFQGSIGKIVDQCVLVSNQSGGALAVGESVRGNGTTAQVTATSGNAAAVGNSNWLGVMVTPAASGQPGYMACSDQAFCLFDGAPTPGAIAYLSPGTPKNLTTTIPAVAVNNNKLRVGRVISASGNTGIVRLTPENLAVLADGLA